MLRSLLLLIITLFPFTAGAADWEFLVEKKAHLILRHDGEDIVTSKFLFWGENWSWASSKFVVEGNKVEGEVPNLLLLAGFPESVFCGT